MIRLMETVAIPTQMDLHTPVNGRMISSEVLEKRFGLMELFMKGHTPWELNMGKE